MKISTVFTRILLVVALANWLLPTVAFSVQRRTPELQFGTQKTAATVHTNPHHGKQNGNDSSHNPIKAVSIVKDDSFVKRQLERDFEQELDSQGLPTNLSVDTMTLNDATTITTDLDDSATLLFPLDLVVGHDLAKKAILLAAVSPKNSLIISGVTGSCKSVLARSVQRLMNQKHMIAVHVPVTIAVDGMIGCVSMEESLETGVAVFEPGLLYKAHDNILLLDDVNLLDESVASILLNDALQEGRVRVEREGLSVEYPCRPAACIATWNPEYEEMREHHLDRFAMHVSTYCTEEGAVILPIQDRVQGVLNVEAFVDRNVVGDPGRYQKEFRLEQALEMEKAHVEKVEMARKLLPQVDLTSDQILYLCRQATVWDCPGQRAEISAAQVARSAAALDGRTRVEATDLDLAVKLCIVPRGRVVLVENSEQGESVEETQPSNSQPSGSSSKPDPQPLAPPPENIADNREKEEDTKEKEDDSSDDTDATEDVLEEPLAIPEQFHFGVDTSVKIDPTLLQFHKRVLDRGRRGGKRHRRFNLQRGRFVKAIFPKGSEGRLAVGATLRAAAPYQMIRRKRIHRSNVSVFVTKDDFRIQQLQKKTGSLIIFVVDASGSMAINRMAAAKGAAMKLLQEAYKSRDKIALIAFSGQEAEVVVPPTKSVALTCRRLESMPCGSQTPLADALVKAVRIASNALKVKKDTGKVALVLISDCRPNVPLCQSEKSDEAMDTSSLDHQTASMLGQPTSRQFLRDEVLAIGKQIGAMDDIDLLCIDTEDKFVHTGIAKELAYVTGGHYHALSRADPQSIHRLISEATAR